MLNEPLPEETFERPPCESLPCESLPDEADELLGAGVADAPEELLLSDEPLPDELLPDELLPDELFAAEAPALCWACAACSANRPRLAAPAVTTTATAHRARPRIVFMASTLTAGALTFLRIALEPSVNDGRPRGKAILRTI